MWGSSTCPAWSGRCALPGSEIRLNLEMITRDPLKVPCLTRGLLGDLPRAPGSTPRPHSLARA